MKIKCQVCGVEGYLQHIGKNYYRVRHYAGFKNGKPVFTYHRQEPEYIQAVLGQGNNGKLDHIDQNTIDQNLKAQGFSNSSKAGKGWAGSSVWNECLTCTPGPITVNWSDYESWLCKNHSYRYSHELLRLSKRFADVQGNPQEASCLQTLSRDLKRNSMAALANLSKYLGMYDGWRGIVRNNGLKWERRSALETFIDIFETNLSDTKAWLFQVVRELPAEYSTVEVFAALTGLRPTEAVNSCKLIVELSSQNRLGEYLDSELMMLKHFRFKDTFLRGCKNAYISFITEELLNLVLVTKPIIKYATLQTRLKRLGLGNQTKGLRKLYATTLRSFVPHEVVDLLQGRISQSVFVRFYYKPFLQDIRTKTLEAMKPLEEKLLTIVA